jgi:hypothetical protein
LHFIKFLKLGIITQVCLEAEEGWWTWHETLQQEMFVFLVFGMMSSDLMLGNPAAGSTSVLGNIFSCYNDIIQVIILADIVLAQ